MIRKWSGLICLAAFGLAGCATPQAQQTADLTAPSVPKMDWSRTPAAKIAAKTPQAQDLVIREHRFVSHSAELNLDGEDQLQQIALALRETPAKIVIESSSGMPILAAPKAEQRDNFIKLDQQRRRFVIQKLLSLGIPDAESRVVLEPAAS